MTAALWLVFFTAVIGMIAAAWLYGRKAGQDSTAKDAATAVLEAADEAQSVRDAVARLDADTQRERLREWSR